MIKLAAPTQTIVALLIVARTTIFTINLKFIDGLVSGHLSVIKGALSHGILTVAN